MKGYFYMEEYKRTAEEQLNSLLLYGKVEITDIELEYRISNKSVYIYSLRYFRSKRDLDNYKRVLSVLREDIASITGDEYLQYRLMQLHDSFSTAHRFNNIF